VDTYVLKSKKDDKLYTGSTNNLKERKKQQVNSTKNRRPLILVYYEAIPTKLRALQREEYFKTAWGKRFIKKQISNYDNEYK